MKRIFTILSIICFFSANLLAQHLPEDILNRFNELRKGNTATPNYERGVIFLLDKSKTDYYSGTTISSTSRTTYTYDKQGKQVSSITENYDAATKLWSESSKVAVTYDAQNNELSYVYQSFDALKKTWFNTFTINRTYNANNTQKTLKFLSYNSSKPDSTDFEAFVNFTYDNNKALIEENETTVAKFATPYQVGNNKRVFTYDASGKKIEVKQYDSKESPAKYTNLTKYLYDTKGNEIKTEEYYITTLLSEVLDIYNEKTYNAKNLLTLNERFSASSGKVNKYEYKYDANNNKIEERYSNVPISTYRLVSVITNTYRQFVNDNNLATVKFSLSPNPVSNAINITAPTVIDAISIFSVDGKIQMSQTSPDSNIDLSRLETGVYIIQLYTKDGIGIQQFIKE